MDFNIIVNEVAYLDLLDAIDYYESKKIGLGEKLFKTYQSKIFALKKNPFYYSYHLEDFRRIPFIDFPYIMIYKIVDNIVIVHEITFEGRSPETISRKLKSK